MERERLYFGIAMTILPFVGLRLAYQPAGEPGRSEPFEGQISIHGRPMSGGIIIFYAEGNASDSAAGRIDARGHFFIPPRGVRNRSLETRFRIILVPTRQIGEAEEDESAFPPELRRLTKLQTTDLEVRLDSQAAKIDIRL